MSSKSEMLKICIACSPGGHMVQIRQLASIYEKYDHFYFTFKGVVADELARTKKVYSIPNIVRHNPLSWFIGAYKSLGIALKEKPDVVMTTGAGVVVFMCLWCKVIGAKLIFIESIAKVEKPTLTARMLYPFSNLFIVQWPNLKSYFPKAQYLGRLL